MATNKRNNQQVEIDFESFSQRVEEHYKSEIELINELQERFELDRNELNQLILTLSKSPMKHDADLAWQQLFRRFMSKDIK